MNQTEHEFNDDGCCIHCGFDGAEHYYYRQQFRKEMINAGESAETARAEANARFPIISCTGVKS